MKKLMTQSQLVKKPRFTLFFAKLHRLRATDLAHFMRLDAKVGALRPPFTLFPRGLSRTTATSLTVLQSLSALLALALLAGCATSSTPSVSSTPSISVAPSLTISAATPESLPLPTVRVAALKGPTAMGMVGMMKADEGKNAYEFSISAAIDEVMPKLVKGTVDIAAVPANLASVLYQNTEGGVRVIGINTLGVLYIIEKGETVQSFADLRGKTIYASGKGATPEYALSYLLEQSGLIPGTDVTIEWKSEHAECVAALAADPKGIALLPQPFVSAARMKDSSMRIALDLNQEWENLPETSGSLLTGVVVVRSTFLEEHPQAVAAFLQDYRTSVDLVTTDLEQAAALIGEYNIIATEVAKEALPYCNIVLIEGNEMKTKLSGYLEVLFTENPKAVGSKLPDEPFYYIP